MIRPTPPAPVPSLDATLALLLAMEATPQPVEPEPSPLEPTAPEPTEP